MEKSARELDYQAIYQTAVYPTRKEARLAFRLFKEWVKHEPKVIYFRNYLALARKPCPLSFFYYAWTLPMLKGMKVTGPPWQITIPNEAIIFYEE